MANIDPRLTKAIREARTGGFAKGSSLQAVVTLRSNDPNKPMDPEQTKRSVNRIVADVGRRLHKEPKDLVIFPNIQAFSIDADAEIIDKILAEDSVDAASLDR